MYKDFYDCVYKIMSVLLYIFLKNKIILKVFEGMKIGEKIYIIFRNIKNCKNKIMLNIFVMLFIVKFSLENFLLFCISLNIL